MTEVEISVRRMHLRDVWTTVMSSSEWRETVMVRYARDGVTGFGEGAPIARYGETAETARVALEAVRGVLEGGDPWRFVEMLERVRAGVGASHAAAVSAVDSALLDWVGKRLGVPVWRYFGLSPERAPMTSFSIGIDTPEVTRRKVLEAAEYPVLKVKVGLGSDEETIRAIRSVTAKPLRVDANEGWTNPEEAVRKIRWLEGEGVELIEQPMPAGMADEMRWVKARVRMPLVADEACTGLGAIAGLAEAYDGINVKLDKSGGIVEAMRWIAAARGVGLRVMLGCMVSSSCACSAAAQMGALADWCDLDGSLLVGDDPFAGMVVRDGRMVMGDGDGLGVRWVG